MKTVELKIDRDQGLPTGYKHLVSSPEVKQLLEGLEGFTDDILYSTSTDFSHLNKILTIDGVDYEISVN